MTVGLPGTIRLQQSNDGVAFFDLISIVVGVQGTVTEGLQRSITVTGGANVVLRVRVETAGAAAAVNANIIGNLIS